MSPLPDTSRNAIRARTAAWMIPPAGGWQRKTGRMFWKPLARPLVVICAIMVLIGYVATTPDVGTRGVVVLMLLGTLGVTITTMLLTIQHRLHEPLTHLRGWALRLRDGDLSARISPPEQGDFSLLAADINQLSDKLQALAEDMEQKVRDQTASLAQKNQSLEILYDVVASLNAVHDLDELLARFLKTLMKVVGARAASVHLVTENGDMRLVASAGLDTSQLSGNGTTALEIADGDDGIEVRYEAHHPLFDGEPMASVFVPLRYQGNNLGGYRLFMESATIAAREDMRDLFATIGRQLGMAVEKTRLDVESQRLILMQERQMIANDLHDSLAQSLASLRMQVAVLGETLQQRGDIPAQNELQKIKKNLDDAYRELRELLLRCRAPMGMPGLVAAIEGAMEYFRQNSGITAFLQNESRGFALDPTSEVQVLRIVQEALANIRKYSKAHHVRVMLRSDDDGVCHVLVEDDGLGISPQKTEALPGERLGLRIMQERAHYLGGTLSVESEPGEGTRVMLMFRARHEFAAGDISPAVSAWDGI
ncbi:MAG: ATP-binding protein [Acidiferrobacteraceae bacterium]